jgi:SAM-dependent methyltransferase
MQVKYTDAELQDHELIFWIRDYKPPFFHRDFYASFFDFSELQGKSVADIGCGGAPISDYSGVSNFDLTIVDPLINSLMQSAKFMHLKKYKTFSGSLFDFNETGYDYVVCLNVIDHFHDRYFNFVNVFHSNLREGGLLWLYFDVRDVDDGHHLSVDSQRLLDKISKFFSIVKIDSSINPVHQGWASVRSSVRLIAQKRGIR